MKTRYKIFLVIGSFIVFYFALIPALQVCIDSNNDCAIWQELVLLTRPVITSSTLGEGIGEWDGTADGMEIPSLEDQISYNLPFVTSMIVLPFIIIGFVVVWDKRK